MSRRKGYDLKNINLNLKPKNLALKKEGSFKRFKLKNGIWIHIGQKVVYKKRFKALDYGEVGILTSTFKACPEKGNLKPWGTVMYQQNHGQNKVYSHSAILEDLIAEELWEDWFNENKSNDSV